MMKLGKKIADAISAIGAINWGLVVFLKFDLVRQVSMGNLMLMQALYGLIAICGVVSLFYVCACCMMGSCKPGN